MKKNLKARGNGKRLTNFEITRDSILEVFKNKYNYEDTIDIECFLDKLSEETLEIILDDITGDWLNAKS